MTQQQIKQQDAPHSGDSTGIVGATTPSGSKPKVAPASSPAPADQGLVDTVFIAGETSRNLKPEMIKEIDLTGADHLTLKGTEELFQLREDLRDGNIPQALPVKVDIVTNDLIDTIGIADLVYEIATLLKEQNKEGSFVKLSQKSSEVLLTESDLDDNFERLDTVINYLENEDTPQNLKGHIQIRVESPEIFKEASVHLHKINRLTKKFSNLKLTVKTPEGTTADTRKELERHYRLNARYAEGVFRIRAESMSQDLKDLHILLREASKDPLNPNKNIDVYFPGKGTLLTENDCQAFLDYFTHFEKNYPHNFTIKSGKWLFSQDPLRKYAFAYALHLGVAHEEESVILSNIRAYRNELRDRSTGVSKETGRMLVKVHNKVPLSFKVKKALAELREYDYWLQDQEISKSEVGIDSKPKAKYDINYFEVVNKRFFPLPRTRSLKLREGSYNIASWIVSNSWSATTSLPVLGRVANGALKISSYTLSQANALYRLRPRFSQWRLRASTSS